MTAQNDTATQPQNYAEEIYKKNLELLIERRRAEKLLYKISEAVIAVDKKYSITLFNHTIEKMLGIKADQALYKHIDDIIHLETDKGDVIPGEDYCFKDGIEEVHLEDVILRSPYSRYYVDLKTSIITEGEAGVECLITMVDMTKERELEKTKDDFISITSHELRTPMSIIKSYLWMLSSGKGGQLSGKQNEYVQKAMRGTERMLALINDMLNISKMEQGRMEINVERINVATELKEILDDFKVKAEEQGLEFFVNLDPEIDIAYADRTKFREVVTNLIGNSFKYTKNGRITVIVEKFGSHFIKMSIIDTGRGIDKDEIKRLFHKFGRLDNSYQTVAESGGTGLGLYITKQLVEAMGGRIGVSSEGPNKGSTFWFTLSTKNPNS